MFNSIDGTHTFSLLMIRLSKDCPLCKQVGLKSRYWDSPTDPQLLPQTFYNRGKHDVVKAIEKCPESLFPVWPDYLFQNSTGPGQDTLYFYTIGQGSVTIIFFIFFKQREKFLSIVTVDPQIWPGQWTFGCDQDNFPDFRKVVWWLL